MSYDLQTDFFKLYFSLHMFGFYGEDRNCFLISEEIFKLRFLLSVIWNSDMDLLLLLFLINREVQQSQWV